MTEDGKEGKSKMIASCRFLQNELRQFSREERVTMADSVETLGVDTKMGVKKLLRAGIAKSGRCRFVDQNLGRIAWSGRRGAFWWKWNM